MHVRLFGPLGFNQNHLHLNKVKQMYTFILKAYEFIVFKHVTLRSTLGFNIYVIGSFHFFNTNATLSNSRNSTLKWNCEFACRCRRPPPISSSPTSAPCRPSAPPSCWTATVTSPSSPALPAAPASSPPPRSWVPPVYIDTICHLQALMLLRAKLSWNHHFRNVLNGF